MERKEEQLMAKKRGRQENNVAYINAGVMLLTKTAQHVQSLLLFSAVLMLVFMGFNYYRSRGTAQVIMTLNYEQASEGLNPNNTRYNVSELESEEVLAQAISYAGLTDELTTQELAQAITVNAANSAGKSDDFINTSYRITVKNLDLGGKVSASGMLGLICKAYKEYFMTNYAENQAVLSFSTDSMDDGEYMSRIELMELRANQLLRYVNGRLKENRTYSNNGESFNDLEQKLQNFIDYDIENITAYVLEHGIAADKESYLSILSYKIRMSTLDYDQKMAVYQVDNEGIKKYNTDMGAIVMVPTRDENNGYYMSRTETEMDYLSKDAEEYLESAKEELTQINYSNYVIEQLESNHPTAAQEAKAEALLSSMSVYLSQLAESVQELDNAFNLYKTKNYITFKSNNEGLVNRLCVKKAAAATAVILVFILLVIYIRILRRLEKNDSGATGSKKETA